MEQHTREVMSCRIQAKQRAVERVRHPGQRMPVPLFAGSQGPEQRTCCQSLADMRILRDVAVVIVIDEWMASDWIVDRQCDNGQQKADYRISLLRRREKADLFFRGQYLDLTTGPQRNTGEEAGKAIVDFVIADC